ncbi:MAG: cytochrome C oxidase subunit IV family protein [Sandaracinus sp.]
MASQKDSHDHDEHGSHDDGAVHVHVHSLRFYGAILGTLILLTVITVATSLVDIDGMIQPGTPQGAGGFNLALAMLIATVKAGFVVTFFMHLKDDNRFNALIFIGSLLFVGIFLAYTMNDTGHRGQGDPYYGVHVLPTTGERAPGGVQCVFEGELAEAGAAGMPVCGEDDSDHIRPCHFVEDGVAPTEGNVCIWENETIRSIPLGQYNAGRVGEAPPHHEEGAAHEEGAEHGEGAEHAE